MDDKGTSNPSTGTVTSRLYRLIGTTMIIVVIVSLIMPSILMADEWVDEFEDICSRVSAADSYSVQELQALIDRSDNLLKKIEASKNRRKKIFIRRLKRCRNFFVFAIEVKQGEKPH